MSFLGLKRSKRTQFRLHPIALVVTVLAIAIMVKLGLWQIERGQEKQAILDQHASAAEQTAAPLSLSLIESAELRTDDRVRIEGQFSPEAYFLIDNQTHNGRVGYHVVALLESDAIGPYLLPVNLGWVAMPGRRDILPEVDLPTQTVTVEGRVHTPAERPFLLREQSFDSQLPQRIQYLELDAISEQMGLPLTQFSVLLDEQADFGLPRDWPVVVMEPHRHYAYALQWFGLAIAALIIFIVASRRRQPSSETTEKHGEEPQNNDNKR